MGIFDNRKAELAQAKESRRQTSIKQAEARQIEPKKTVTPQLPSMEQQLRTATTAFKPTVKPTVVSPEIDRLQKMADANKAAGKRSTAGMSRDDYVAYAKIKQVEAKQQDAARDKGVVEKAGQFLGQFYTPGAGLGAITAGTQAVGNILSRVAPAIGRGTGLGATVAREAIKEGVTGIPLAAGQALAQEPGISGRELAKQTALGAGLGAAAGPIGPLLGRGIQAARGAAGDVARGAIQVAGAPEQPRIARTVPSQRVSAPQEKVPTPNSVTPEDFAKYVNQNASYHGTGGDIAGGVDITRTSPESVLGEGLYISNKPSVAQDYAKLRGAGAGKVYQANTNFRKVLDLQATPSNEVVQSVLNSLDDAAKNEIRPLLTSGNLTGQRLIESARTLAGDKNLFNSNLIGNLTNNNYDAMSWRRGVGEDSYLETSVINPNAINLSDYKPAIEPPLPPVIAPPAAEAMKGNWFTNLFGPQGVGITPGLGRGGRNLATTEGQIVSQPLRTDVQGVKAQAQSMARTAYNNQVDFTKPLKYIDENAYESAQDVRRANNLANTTIQDKFVDVQGNVIGPSLKEIGNKVARGEGNAFEDYLILRHAQTRMARGERVYAPELNMTIPKVQERLNVLNARYPQFAGIASEWDGYNSNLLGLGVQEGLISEAQRAAMETANPNYASMRRQFTTAEKYAQPFAMKTKGFSGQKAPIKEVSPTGSVRKIVSPFRSAIEQTGAWYNASMRNRVMQNVYNRINVDPESLKGIIEISPETAEATKKSIDEINDILKTDGMEGLMEKLNDELSVMFRKRAKTDNIVTAMIKGHPVKLRVENPEVFKALVGMGPEESNFVMDIVGSLSKATKYGATGPLAPLFATRSLTTDVAQSIIQSKNPLAHLYDLTHSIVSSIANKLPQGTPGVEKLRELAQDFSRTGGEYSAALMGDRALRESVGGILRKPFLSPRGAGRIAVETVKAPFKLLNSISDISENVNRMAAYKGALRRQGNARTPEAIRNAMRESQEITTNFSRKGAKSEGIEKFIPYTNAAVQGIRRFAKQWVDNPIKTAAAVGGLVIAPKLYEYAAFSDDPDYQKIPARDKYRHIIVFKNADGTFNKVPMPPEYNAIGAAMVDLLVGYKDGDPVNWRQTANAIVNAYTPPFLGGALQGVTQGGGIEQSLTGAIGATSAAAPVSVVSNRSFTGAPIVPQRLAGVSPEQQFDERTSSIAKQIGKTVGLAPLKVDYLIRAYGGDPARLLLPLTAEVGAGTPRNTLLKNFIVDPVFTNTLTTDFYDMKEKITQAKADKSIQGVELPAWYKESVADYVTNQRKDGMSKQLSELTTSKREIQGNKSLDAKQKASQLRDVQAKMNEIYLDAITRMREGGVPTGR